MKFIIAMGLPSSGKTTLLTNIYNENKDKYVLFSEDYIDIFTAVDRVKNFIGNKTIIFDYLFTTKDEVIRLLKEVKNIDNIVIYMSTMTREQCLQMSKQRNKQVDITIRNKPLDLFVDLDDVKQCLQIENIKLIKFNILDKK